MICDMCHEDKTTVQLQPSRNQLLFGGWHVRYEHRCQQCETKVTKWLNNLIKTNLGTTKCP